VYLQAYTGCHASLMLQKEIAENIWSSTFNNQVTVHPAVMKNLKILFFISIASNLKLPNI